MKNCSVLCSMTTSGLDTHFMFGRSSASTRDWKTLGNLYNAVFANIRWKENKEKTKNLHKNIKRDVGGSSKEEVTHGGPI